MTVQTTKRAVAARLNAHAECAGFHPFPSTATGTHGTLLKICDILGWTADRKMHLPPELPRAAECIAFVTPERKPHLLMVAEPAGPIGVEQEMLDAATGLGFPFMVVSNVEDWSFIDLQSRQVLSLVGMIGTDEAERALAALSPDPKAPEAFRDLLSYLHVVDDLEQAVARMMVVDRERLASHALQIALERGACPDPERVRSMVMSVRSPLEAMLCCYPAPSEFTAARARAYRDEVETAALMEEAESGLPASEEPIAGDVPPGTVLVDLPSVKQGRRFEYVVDSAASGTLKAGSQIARAVAKTDRYGNLRARWLFAAHESVLSLGAVVEDTDGSGAPCFRLTRDVPGLTRSAALGAIYGTAKSTAASFYVRGAGMSLKAWREEGGIAAPVAA